MNALGTDIHEVCFIFASSLERFYEFFIKLQMVNLRHLLRTFTDEAWKKLSNQSERQLGAFTYLYLSSLGELPPELSSKERGFRNDVIHKRLHTISG